MSINRAWQGLQHKSMIIFRKILRARNINISPITALTKKILSFLNQVRTNNILVVNGVLLH